MQIWQCLIYNGSSFVRSIMKSSKTLYSLFNRKFCRLLIKLLEMINFNRIESNQTKTNPTKPNQTKPKQTEPNPTKKNKSNQTNQDKSNVNKKKSYHLSPITQ